MNDLIFAANDAVTLAVSGDKFFTDTALGTAIASLMKAAALLIVLAAAIKGIKEVLAGKAGKAASIIIGAVVVVAFLWNPEIIGSLVQLGSDLVGKGVDDVDSLAK